MRELLRHDSLLLGSVCRLPGLLVYHPQNYLRYHSSACAPDPATPVGLASRTADKRRGRRRMIRAGVPENIEDVLRGTADGMKRHRRDRCCRDDDTR